VRELAPFPLVKVCGFTDAAEARAAALAGAGAIGLVDHATSPRRVALTRAAEIVAALPTDCLAVAVFVDRDREYVFDFLRRSGARAAQLCGSERASEWSDFPYPILRRVGVAAGAEAEIASWRTCAAGFVLDHPSAPGGTGRAAELLTAARLVSSARPCLLAGGLDERNVAERIAAVRPDGVDASSRLESAPGRKDLARVEPFVRRARLALAEVRA
jgi:phosphoribosylanthranilate isomerase